MADVLTISRRHLEVLIVGVIMSSCSGLASLPAGPKPQAVVSSAELFAPLTHLSKDQAAFIYTQLSQIKLEDVYTWLLTNAPTVPMTVDGQTVADSRSVLTALGPAFALGEAHYGTLGKLWQGQPSGELALVTTRSQSYETHQAVDPLESGEGGVYSAQFNGDCTPEDHDTFADLYYVAADSLASSLTKLSTISGPQAIHVKSTASVLNKTVYANPVLGRDAAGVIALYFRDPQAGTHSPDFQMIPGTAAHIKNCFGFGPT